jgi:succinate dehydrogenase/fumarate reductase flavoprotein subunit
MAMEHQRGKSPLFLDMSGIAEDEREQFIRGKVQWMERFFAKLGPEARTDMFGRTPYFPLNQMTKMAIRTGTDCRSDIPGLLAAGLAQAGCANHFAGFHIGMSIGTGWIAGRSAAEDLDGLPEPILDAGEVAGLRSDAYRPLDAMAAAESDRLLRELQTLMFRYDVMIWKRADRLESALARVAELRAEIEAVQAPHAHELVRLKETEAMVLAAEIMLRASLTRTESRLSHFREDCEARDDRDWLAWVDVREERGAPTARRTPIPTPVYSVAEAGKKPVARRARRYVSEPAGRP